MLQSVTGRNNLNIPYVWIGKNCQICENLCSFVVIAIKILFEIVKFKYNCLTVDSKRQDSLSK